MSDSCSTNVTARQTDWRQINWKQANRNVRHLRQRIYRATSTGDLKKVRSLQRLMLRSYSNTVVSVRRVTQQNAGRHIRPEGTRVWIRSWSRRLKNAAGWSTD